MSYKTFFGLQKEPFCQDIRVEDLYPLPGLQAAAERFRYALNLGAASIIIGDVGSGKSTALRYAASKLHPPNTKSSPSSPPPAPSQTSSGNSATASMSMAKPTPWPG